MVLGNGEIPSGEFVLESEPLGIGQLNGCDAEKVVMRTGFVHVDFKLILCNQLLEMLIFQLHCCGWQ